MDGDLLLNITDHDLSSDLSMAAGLTRKRQVIKKKIPKQYSEPD